MATSVGVNELRRKGGGTSWSRSLTPLALALLATNAVAADSGSPVAVLTLSDSPSATSELIGLTGLVREAFSGQVSSVLSAEETTRRLKGDDGLPLGQFDAAYLNIVASFQDGRHAQAIESLRSLLARLDCGAHVGRWSGAMMRLASMEDQLGHREEARELIGRILTVDPTFSANPELFRPSFVQQVEEQRRRLRSVPRTTVTLTTIDPGASICIWGHQVGVGTATLGLPPGSYLVGATTASGLRVPPSKLEVGAPPVTFAVDLGLAESVRTDRGPALVSASRHAAPPVRDLLARLGVGRLVLVSARGVGRERMLVVDEYAGREGRLHAEARLRLAGDVPPPGGVPALVTLLVSGQTSPLVDLGLLSVERTELPEGWESGMPTSHAFAEGQVTVHLKGGRNLRGTLLKKTDRLLFLRSAHGSVREIPLSEVERIE